MPRNTLPVNWQFAFCTHIARGATVSEAADAVGCTPQNVYQRLREQPDFKAMYDDARDRVRDKIRHIVWRHAMEGEAPDSQTFRWAIDKLCTWNKMDEPQRIELAQTVEVKHERGMALVDVFDFARTHNLERYLPGARDDVSDAGEVLPEPGEPERAPGDVSAD